MGFFSDFYRWITNKSFEQTWEVFDWSGDEEFVKEKVKDLVQSGADINGTNYSENLMREYDVLYNDTPLSLALHHHQFSSAEFLVEKGAKNNDKTPYAIKHFCYLVELHNKYVKMEEMKKNGLDDPLMRFDKVFKQGDLEKMEHLMDTMLKKGFSVQEAVSHFSEKSTDVEYMTDALTLAAEAGNFRLVKFLHEKGAPINRTEMSFGRAKYKSAMGAAAASGNVEILKYLLENGGKVNPEHLSFKEPSPLSKAVMNKDETVADFLLENGADVNLPTDKRNWTPLMYAAAMEDEAEASRWADKLLAHGADATVRNIDGETASQIAQRYYNKETLSQKLAIVAKKQQNQRRQEVDVVHDNLPMYANDGR